VFRPIRISDCEARLTIWAICTGPRLTGVAGGISGAAFGTLAVCGASTGSLAGAGLAAAGSAAGVGKAVLLAATAALGLNGVEVGCGVVAWIAEVTVDDGCCVPELVAGAGAGEVLPGVKAGAGLGTAVAAALTTGEFDEFCAVEEVGTVGRVVVVVRGDAAEFTKVWTFGRLLDAAGNTTEAAIENSFCKLTESLDAACEFDGGTICPAAAGSELFLIALGLRFGVDSSAGTTGDTKGRAGSAGTFKS
jgi:hypothetical protein